MSDEKSKAVTVTVVSAADGKTIHTFKIDPTKTTIVRPEHSRFGYVFEPEVVEYGRIHTDGSRSGGQPLHSDVERVARALAQADGIEICSDATYALSSYGHKAQAALAAMRQPTQSDAEITEADCNVAEYIAGDRARDLDYQVVAYHRKWSVLEERAKIVAWLMREEDDYPSGKYSGFAAIIREEIEAGEHLK